MAFSVFWMIVSLLLSSPNPIPEIEKLVNTFYSPERKDQITGDIHFDSTVIDGHADTMMHIINEDSWLPEVNIGEDTSLNIDIPKLQEGGLDAIFFAAYTSGYHGNNPRSISRTLAMINALYWTEKNNADQLQITSNTLDIIESIRRGEIAAVPTIEGGYSLEEHNAIELLHQYHDLGIKAVGFNWNYSNALGEGANRVYGDPEKTPSQGGLTELGAAVAKEMNKLGMVIDVSHMAESTFWDVMEVTGAPIMATHSGVNALHDHQRNLTDEQLKAIKENNGVVGIVFYPAFLTDEPEAYAEDVVDHIEYVVNLIGIDHVALGSDFDGSDMPADIQDVTDLPKITDELLNRGYSNEDIEKILGKNTLRLLMDVEKAAELVPYNNGNTTDLAIDAAFEMGEMLDSTTPLLTAEIKTANDVKIEESSLHVVVDGIEYEAQFDSDQSTMSVQVQEPLREKFHVVTFEAAAENGESVRDTRIFYIEDW
ncbi:dipeptidase [Oceanobacillus damuensis]|uniref:dipeptidase n=1 Tax=Oceanobacillus damuensis TaxID=937928 RepID=UPI0008356C7C|nr:dipeptidase [Oceanobacillus damuensis]